MIVLGHLCESRRQNAVKCGFEASKYNYTCFHNYMHSLSKSTEKWNFIKPGKISKKLDEKMFRINQTNPIFFLHYHFNC